MKNPSNGWERLFGVGVATGGLALAIAAGCGSSEDGGKPASGESDVTNNASNDPNGSVPGSSTPTDTTDSGAPLDDGTKFPAGEETKIECSPIAEGKVEFTVNGKKRSFHVQLPQDTSRMSLLFLWHGWNQDPVTFRDEVVYDVPKAKWVAFDPNAFDVPLMIITPVDTGLIPPIGLDWDIVSGARDFPYFEGMLKCIGEQFNIDGDRIYSFGFSAGAVFTNLLSAKYPHLFAATISESGAWFNDKPEQKDVLVPIIGWKWPDFDPADGGNVLLTHGGKKDFATVISLESANQKAIPYLKTNKRTVVECEHDFGHTLEPDLTQTMIYEYMSMHTLGGARLTALPPSFPTKEKPVGRSTCTFRPAE